LPDQRGFAKAGRRAEQAQASRFFEHQCNKIIAFQEPGQGAGRIVERQADQVAGLQSNG
jgi:hypothetical protein